MPAVTIRRYSRPFSILLPDYAHCRDFLSPQKPAALAAVYGDLNSAAKITGSSVTLDDSNAAQPR
jgi:hypothetical protein